MKNPKLKPILIEYSNSKHRQGTRQYFEGQYKFDYGPYTEVKHNDMNNNIHILYHDRRSQSLTLNYPETKQTDYKQKQEDKRNLRSRTQKSVDQETRRKQFFRSPSKNIRTFDVTTESIQLPKISTISPKNPEKMQTFKKLKMNIKPILYICANEKCSTKSPPKVQQTAAKPLQLVSKKKIKNKAKLIKIAPQPQVRKRYTPTFVCSHDNPLPCFKIFQTI